MGLSPGFMIEIIQRSRSFTRKPAFRHGINPALIREDLPLPELPVTATKWCRYRRWNNSNVCSCLPKNKKLSLLLNCRRPIKGLLSEIIVMVQHLYFLEAI